MPCGPLITVAFHARETGFTSACSFHALHTGSGRFFREMKVVDDRTMSTE